jgi:hypothetical protein
MKSVKKLLNTLVASVVSMNDSGKSLGKSPDLLMGRK